MTGQSLFAAAVTGALIAATSAGSAVAASAVTFVSGLGRDSGACTRTAPCRRFRYAITQTSPGGTIAALDRAGFGSVRITQSVSILGPGKGGAGMSPIDRTNNNVGVDIQAPGATVILRGLEIDGGTTGINIGQATVVVITDCMISNSSSLAINALNNATNVLVRNTSILHAEVDTYATTFVASRMTISGSPGYGFNPLGGHVVIDDSTVSGSASVNVAVYGSTTVIKQSLLPFAGLRGIDVTSGSTAYVDSTTTFGNGQFSIIVGGTAYSYGNNNFPENTSGTITPIAGD